MKDRATILLTIGEIAVAVKEYPNEFLQYIKPVMNEVSLVVSQAAKSNSTTLQTVASTKVCLLAIQKKHFSHS